MLSETQDLLHGDPATWAAFLGVSVRQVNNYKIGKTALPECARKLLRLRRTGDLAALLGKAWEGFSFGPDGLLYVPGWANGMQPAHIRAMFFTNQEAAALRVERARWLGESRAAQTLGDLIALQVSNDSNGPDDTHGDVLRPRHAPARRS